MHIEYKPCKDVLSWSWIKPSCCMAMSALFTEISNSLGRELTWSNDELSNIINTYRLRFVYLCVYAIGAILWRPFEWVWCMFLKFPSYSKCITNVNKSIVICCFGNTEISNSLGGELTWSNDELNNIINTYRLRFVYLCVYVIGTMRWGTVWMSLMYVPYVPIIFWVHHKCQQIHCNLLFWYYGNI